MPLGRRSYILFLSWVSLIAAHPRAFAGPAGTLLEPSEGSQQQASDAEPSDYNGEDFTRPENRFDLRLRDRSSGSNPRTYRSMAQLRIEGGRNVAPGWKIAWFAQLPVDEKTAPNGLGSEHEFGIGDAAVQAALIREINERWAFGFGARLTAPTAEDRLGSGKWQVMPGFGLRYSFLEFGSDTYFVPKIRYAISIAGDPARRMIDEPQIAPTLNIGLPGRWFVTLYPSYDIRINDGSPISGQTGRLFLPFDAAVGLKVTDSFVISLEGSVPIIKDYPVYSFKTELRTAIQF